jgi:flavin reductase (DIM6/NTAB) family NADH-FMN oxidoreductase RutF
MLSVGWKDEKSRKDTWVNIDERSHFVVNLPSVSQVQDVSNSSSVLPHGVSEIDRFNIPVETIEDWPLPKIRRAKVAFLCEKYAIYEIGNDPQGMILGQIKRIWIDDQAVTEINNRLVVDAAQMDPLLRLGGNHYAHLGEILTVKRPDKET